MEPYYYQRLSKPMQEAYHAIKRGVESLSPAFPVPRLEMEQLSEVLFYLRLDCPEIFYITNFSCRVHPDALRVEFCPEYLFDKGRIREHQKALRARVERLARPAQAFTEWEKERYIHDFICTQVRYDKLKKPYSHEIIGPLGQGVGVCEGIAKSVKALCDQLGLWCIVVISENAPEKGIKYRHAWNVVRIGGRSYHLDATFDNSVGTPELIRYDYFNLEDRRIFRDHEPLITPAPTCTDGDGFYYRMKKLSFTKLEEVERRGEQAARKKKELVFHWRGGYLTRAVLKDILQCLERAGESRGVHPRVRLNWPQAVLQVAYTPECPQHMLDAQQANEGEELEAPMPQQETAGETFS